MANADEIVFHLSALNAASAVDINMRIRRTRRCAQVLANHTQDRALVVQIC